METGGDQEIWVRGGRGDSLGSDFRVRARLRMFGGEGKGDYVGAGLDTGM